MIFSLSLMRKAVGTYITQINTLLLRAVKLSVLVLIKSKGQMEKSGGALLCSFSLLTPDVSKDLEAHHGPLISPG